jgi:hypothetical protein
MALNLLASPKGLFRDVLHVLPHVPYLYLLMVLIIDINHLSPFVKSKLYDFFTFLSFYDVKFALNCVKNIKVNEMLERSLSEKPSKMDKASEC